jgi:hypothetical protein
MAVSIIKYLMYNPYIETFDQILKSSSHPTPSGKDVLHGPGPKFHRTDGRSDKDRPLAVRYISQQD